MSAYCPNNWKPGSEVFIRIKGIKRKKKVKDYYFISAPGHNCDHLVLEFEGRLVQKVDNQFISDNEVKQ